MDEEEEGGEGRCGGRATNKKRKRLSSSSGSRAMETLREPTPSLPNPNPNPNANAKTNAKTKKKNGDDEKDLLAWADSLSDSQLDLMMSIKEVAKERMVNSGGKYLEGSLPPRALQALGVILEELAKYRAKAILSESDNTSV